MCSHVARAKCTHCTAPRNLPWYVHRHTHQDALRRWWWGRSDAKLCHPSHTNQQAVNGGVYLNHVLPEMPDQEHCEMSRDSASATEDDLMLAAHVQYEELRGLAQDRITQQHLPSPADMTDIDTKMEEVRTVANRFNRLRRTITPTRSCCAGVCVLLPLRFLSVSLSLSPPLSRSLIHSFAHSQLVCMCSPATSSNWLKLLSFLGVMALFGGAYAIYRVWVPADGSSSSS
eukprot:COSAG02_NODE_298_length_25350_cov_48.266999_25_plen_230_part_00